MGHADVCGQVLEIFPTCIASVALLEMIRQQLRMVVREVIVGLWERLFALRAPVSPTLLVGECFRMPSNDVTK